MRPGGLLVALRFTLVGQELWARFSAATVEVAAGCPRLDTPSWLRALDRDTYSVLGGAGFRRIPDLELIALAIYPSVACPCPKSPQRQRSTIGGVGF
jgi:hypothetical protein